MAFKKTRYFLKCAQKQKCKKKYYTKSEIEMEDINFVFVLLSTVETNKLNYSIATQPNGN